MSEEQLKAFLEKVKSDTELQDKLKAAASPEAALQIAKEAGFSITAEDIQSMQSVEVSDKELEAAAGGAFLSMENWDVLSNDWCCRPLKDYVEAHARGFEKSMPLPTVAMTSL